MQYLVNYRQTALEQLQALAAMANADVVVDPPSSEEVWSLRILIATLVILVWWAIVED